VIAMRWIGLALAGVLIAAAVAFAASRLASQQIGLASEPVTAGDALAPKAIEHTHPTRHSPHRTQSPPTTTTLAEPTESIESPSNTPPPASPEPGQPDGHDGEHGGGADD
jgi:hypothetical protein